MKTTCLITLIIALAIAGTAGADPSGIPDPWLSFAVCAYSGPGTPTVMNLPNGIGNRFDQARLADGTVVDATITLTLLDGLGSTIMNYPFEDLWIESLDGGLVFCPGGTTADANTDQSGHTFWRKPMFAGGYSPGPCQVLVSGMPLYSAPLPVAFNSPDITGNLVVDLQDLGYFVTDYFGTFDPRSDFFRNSILDLSDVGMLALGFGADCP